MLNNLKIQSGFIICMMLFVLCNGCKFYSFTGADISTEIKTYTINPFQDEVLINPNYSQILTQKLIDKLATETNLSPVSKGGDVEFFGTVTRYSVNSVAASGGDVAAQDELRIQIKVDFKNFVEDDADWSSNFSSFSNFDKNTNFSDVEDVLIEEINDFLVNDIFNKAFVNW